MTPLQGTTDKQARRCLVLIRLVPGQNKFLEKNGIEKNVTMTRPVQLQTTFMKALNDGNRTVRLMAGSALGYLIAIHMRPGMTTLINILLFTF